VPRGHAVVPPSHPPLPRRLHRHGKCARFRRTYAPRALATCATAVSGLRGVPSVATARRRLPLCGGRLRVGCAGGGGSDSGLAFGGAWCCLVADRTHVTWCCLVADRCWRWAALQARHLVSEPERGGGGAAAASVVLDSVERRLCLGTGPLDPRAPPRAHTAAVANMAAGAQSGATSWAHILSAVAADCKGAIGDVPNGLRDIEARCTWLGTAVANARTHGAGTRVATASEDGIKDDGGGAGGAAPAATQDLWHLWQSDAAAQNAQSNAEAAGDGASEPP